ncbi:MAG: Fluoroquinolones export ATP-binding protein [Phycisphaerales bacterium]|nr:Fluoroquinolones export ATP-binding protein [Phycisphaerales bacterium]
MDDAIAIEGVRKVFGDFVAVENLSLRVPAGKLCGFIGPNGSGKTTTLRLIMRIYAPDAGTVRVLGDSRHGPADDRVGYLPEERMLYKSMRVGEVLTYLSRLKGYKPNRIEIDQWLERLALPGVARRRVQTLSKGQTQKIQLIAVLIAKPKLVLLDEPFSGLDPVNSNVMRDAILELKNNGTTVLFSTHDMASAEELCDRIVMIYKGNKVMDGTINEIRAGHNTDTLRVRLANLASNFDNLPGVACAIAEGDHHELQLTPTADAQAILRELQQRGPVELFEIARPSLHDLFVRTVHEGAA